LNRGRHLYLAGWPSRWALAHISSIVDYIMYHMFILCDLIFFLCGKDISYAICSVPMFLSYRALKSSRMC